MKFTYKYLYNYIKENLIWFDKYSKRLIFRILFKTIFIKHNLGGKE